MLPLLVKRPIQFYAQLPVDKYELLVPGRIPGRRQECENRFLVSLHLVFQPENYLLAHMLERGIDKYELIATFEWIADNDWIRFPIIDSGSDHHAIGVGTARDEDFTV